MELDKDLLARQEARDLCRRAHQAQKFLGSMPQDRIDSLCRAVSHSFAEAAGPLAELAVRETGFGCVKDKEIKNRFASRQVWAAIRDMKTVGILRKDPGKKLWDIAVPVGVIGAIVPSTNPTSTVCYKALISLKSGSSIVFSPHPKALACTLEATKVIQDALAAAGGPRDAVSCLSRGAMAGTQELMAAPEVRLLLATGGPAMVKAAYSSGKPAIGVGAGNGPAYIHKSADVADALKQIRKSKDFDHGTVCASEQSILLERDMENPVTEAAKQLGYYFMSTNEADRMASLLFRPDGVLNADIVGKPAEQLAQKAGFSVPEGTRILVARAGGVGAKYPYSMEKLCPVLGLYVEENEDAVLARALEILRHEGSGHTFSIHARDEAVITRFALQIPVSRFLVNTPAALGGIGATTGLFPALTLGCGAVGGSSSSGNISPLDLLDIRRVAWDTEPAPQVDDRFLESLAARLLERLR